MKIDVLDLSKVLNYESQLVSIYNIIEIIFNLKNSLAYNNFATY